MGGLLSIDGSGSVLLGFCSSARARSISVDAVGLRGHKEAISSCLVIMDPKHSAEMSKHLDKQNQVLMGTYRVMSHELHKLQVEEETIMRKLYELMSTEGLLPKCKKERKLEQSIVESTQENKEGES
ncbi:uncharacterized protein LOC133916704 isoform X1 [Phragmites australis]|uniref:uncharacterized protein LOC133916704 isoform X1 n=2 Tax=Phragmites australis TaxID=29695 RepID=UPI002D797A6F|nr:uncharacterized protein LOC133916704 isoform X1 [Phragmites australis]